MRTTGDAPRKASDWLGHAVTTRDGKELGTVRDFAIDADTGKLIYVVVSVGRFLIENNLIAVAPDALGPSRADDGKLELDADADALVHAERFASDSRWPATTDVVRDNGHPAADPGGDADAKTKTATRRSPSTPTA